MRSCLHCSWSTTVEHLARKNTAALLLKFTRRVWRTLPRWAFLSSCGVPMFRMGGVFAYSGELWSVCRSPLSTVNSLGTSCSGIAVVWTGLLCHLQSLVLHLGLLLCGYWCSWCCCWTSLGSWLVGTITCSAHQAVQNYLLAASCCSSLLSVLFSMSCVQLHFPPRDVGLLVSWPNSLIPFSEWAFILMLNQSFTAICVVRASVQKHMYPKPELAYSSNLPSLAYSSQFVILQQ